MFIWMLNVRIIMSDQGFPFFCGVCILLFGDSPSVDRVVEERDRLRDHIYLASFSGKCPEVEKNVAPSSLHLLHPVHMTLTGELLKISLVRESGKKNLLTFGSMDQ